MRHPGPRLFVIVATEAPVAAVVRRGPSDWCHVGRWQLDDGRYIDVDLSALRPDPSPPPSWALSW